MLSWRRRHTFIILGINQQLLLYICVVKMHTVEKYLNHSKVQKKILGCRDPRYKHEYLDRVQSWITVTGNQDDESDKHLEARDRRYSCLKSWFHEIFCIVPFVLFHIEQRTSSQFHCIFVTKLWQYFAKKKFPHYFQKRHTSFYVKSLLEYSVACIS